MKLVKFQEAGLGEVYVNVERVSFIRPHGSDMTTISFGDTKQFIVVQASLVTVASALANAGKL